MFSDFQFSGALWEQMMVFFYLSELPSNSVNKTFQQKDVTTIWMNS